MANIDIATGSPSYEVGSLLDNTQWASLVQDLAGRLVVVCFGAGVDSTATLVALRDAEIRPDAITFADTGGEKSATYAHVQAMNEVLAAWRWPPITVCRAVPKATTGYVDLYGNCVANETLPSLAFGMKSCSIRWKQLPQDQVLRGVSKGPNARPAHPLWVRAQAEGKRIVKLIGYDCGRADMRRAKAPKPADADFDYAYPLQRIGWARPDCVRAIAKVLGAHLVPMKSSCFFCPASKPWELFWLAANEPDLLERALYLERNALTGRHSRFDTVEFGATWEDLVRNADAFPSSKTTVGLGRSFAWNHWAHVNRVVDAEFKVLRAEHHRFAQLADAMRGVDNALDGRTELAAIAA